MTLFCAAGVAACSNSNCNDTRTCSGPEDQPDGQTAATGGNSAASTGGSGISTAGTGNSNAGGAPSSSGGAATGGTSTGETSTGGVSGFSGGAGPDSGGEIHPADAGAGDGASDAAIACPPGFADCNGDVRDGCEAELSVNPDHCGSCGVSCEGAGTVSRACVQGSCAPSCDTGHLDCDKDGADGCEVDKTDPDHCGGCAHACGNSGVATRTCSSGVCKPTCDTSHLDCNGNGDDGCEVDGGSDLLNCGGCKIQCSLAGATSRTCSSGVCKPTCDASHLDCNGNGADGCETDITTSTNCGACGRDCVGGTCSNGVCQRVVIADNLDSPTKLTVDGKFVHWLEIPADGDGVLARTPLAGTARTVVAINQGHASDISSDGTFVYWGNRNSAPSGSALNGTIERVTSGVSDPKMIAGAIDVFALTADSKNVYYIDLDGGSLGQVGTVYQVPNDGSAAPKSISMPLSSPVDIAVDAKDVFVGETQNLDMFAIGGGGVFVQTENTTPQILTTIVAVDATHVYSTAYDSTKGIIVLGQMPKTLAGNPKSLATLEAGHTNAIATDSKYVYFGLSSGLYRVSNAGGPAALLSPAGGDISSIAVSKGVVYWIDQGPSAASGNISKLAVF